VKKEMLAVYCKLGDLLNCFDVYKLHVSLAGGSSYGVFTSNYRA